MRYEMANTIAEAEAQTLPPIRYEGWQNIALMLHYIYLQQEMGLSDGWYDQREQEYERTGSWGASTFLEYRLLLAINQRREYWGGDSIDPVRQFDVVNSLLAKIAELLGQPYTIGLAERERIVQQDASRRAR